MDDFIVSKETTGYVYVGHVQGQFEVEGGEKRPYFNIYVISPVSSYKSEDYDGYGFKAEKIKCISASVWANLAIGEQVNLFFDDKHRVQMVVSMPVENSSSRSTSKATGKAS